MNQKEIKKIIQSNNIQHRCDLINFIDRNRENYSVSQLSKIAELVNNNRDKTGAYYTDEIILKYMEQYLPTINKKVIKILEPSVGTGNFLPILLKKYKYAEKVIIEVNDIDGDSIKITEKLNNFRNIPDNFEIIYNNNDFLSDLFYQSDRHYDLIVGNPPFVKLNKRNGLVEYASIFNDDITNNTAGFFLQKAVKLADYIFMIMPKYFLHNEDFKKTRNIVEEYKIDSIVDFGEKGFKGVLIETIAILINTKEKRNYTKVYSVPKKIKECKKQNYITDDFPCWLIYRNNFFDSISENMIFNIFKVFRDRQITNKILSSSGDIRVLKSRNISRDGKNIISIDGYDSYISKENLNKLRIKEYLSRDDVYLVPNMTYYPRIKRKPKKMVVNGSIAILENKTNMKIKESHLDFINSKEFREFYAIARNYSTRSLNIDNISIYFFGLYK